MSQPWEKIVVRRTGANALAVFKQDNRFINTWMPKREELWLAVESVEKPGNLGAILRTADAANISALIVCDELVDIFHPNVIRNSLGCVFTVPVIICSSQQAIDAFNRKKICIFSTFMEESISLFSADLTSGVALVVGTEHQGLSPVWRNKGQNINIPMLGQVDSLNVSVASAILMYEARRQRLV